MVKISIVIPVYNCELYLEQCIKSVLCQSLSELEVVCVDDGSTDSSNSIIRLLATKDPRVVLLQQNRQGAGMARNLGIRKAKGKYICFLDADDFYLDENALKKMVDACERMQLLACAGLRKLYKNNRVEDYFLYREYFEKGKNSEGIILEYNDIQHDYYYTNYIFSLEVIRKNNIYFPTYRRYEDPVFFVKTMMEIGRYIVLPVEFYGYRIFERTLSGEQIKDGIRGIKDNLIIAIDNQLSILEDLLILRIVQEYGSWIIKNIDQEILDLLDGLQRVIIEDDTRSEVTNNHVISLKVLRLIVEAELNVKDWISSFENKGLIVRRIKGGIRGTINNLKIARDNHLPHLENLLIFQVVHTYASWIIDVADYEILSLLDEIQEMMVNSDQETVDKKTHMLSLEIIRMMAELHIEDKSLGGYFKDKGIKSIAVYGLGVIGKLFIRECEKSSEILLYGVDRKVKHMEKIEIDSIDGINKKCTDIIVTPIKENENIVKDIKGKWRGKVWSLTELLCMMRR